MQYMQEGHQPPELVNLPPFEQCLDLVLIMFLSMGKESMASRFNSAVIDGAVFGNPIRPKFGDPLVLMAIAVDPAALGLEDEAPRARKASAMPRGRCLRRGPRV